MTARADLVHALNGEAGFRLPLSLGNWLQPM
jgi:hypothetical protein